jgi:hypothetical protein
VFLNPSSESSWLSAVRGLGLGPWAGNPQDYAGRTELVTIVTKRRQSLEGERTNCVHNILGTRGECPDSRTLHLSRDIPCPIIQSFSTVGGHGDLCGAAVSGSSLRKTAAC